MTAVLAPRPAVREEGPDRPALRPVGPVRRRMSKLPFMLVLALVMAVGMVGLLVLNTALQGQAFLVQDKQSQANALGYRLSDLEARIAEARSAHHLALAAQELGMKPNPYPLQLRLPDGDVSGTPERVMGGEVPAVRFRTPEQAEAEERARARAEARKKAEAEARRQAADEARRKAAAEAREKRAAQERAAAEERAATGETAP